MEWESEVLKEKKGKKALLSLLLFLLKVEKKAQKKNHGNLEISAVVSAKKKRREGILTNSLYKTHSKYNNYRII